MAEGAVADYLAGLGVAYALKTRQSLGSDWLCFARWCAEEAHVSFPATPATVVAYLEAQAAGHSVATLRRRLATLSHLHDALCVANPTRNRAVKLTRDRKIVVSGKSVAVRVDLGGRQLIKQK